MASSKGSLSLGADEMEWADDAPPLRRASASLPAALHEIDSPDLNLTPVSSQLNDEVTDSSFSDNELVGSSEEEEEDEDLKQSLTTPLKSPGKNARLVPPVLKINDVDYLEVPDQYNSITSVNSIASLLREKIALSLPTMLKQTKPPTEYKIKGFVSFLFLCIIFLVGFAHMYYHQHVLQRAYFERIRFNNEERFVRVFNSRGKEIIHGYVGVMLDGSPMYDCLPQDRHEGTICKEWLRQARFYMKYKQIGEERCYDISWQALSPDTYPMDCYGWDGRYSHWYGGGYIKGMTWPYEKGSVELSPFITGNDYHHNWGNALRRYFISSLGVSIVIEPTTPLYVSINDTEHPKQLCIQAKYDKFAFIPNYNTYPQLNYSVCTSYDIKTLFNVMADRNLWDGMKREDLDTLFTLISEPIWQLSPSKSEELSEVTVFNYTEEALDLIFLKQGHVLLNEKWQSKIGDFTVDVTRFPTLQETISILHRRGFRIVFTLQPYISTESTNFQEAVKEQLLVSQRDTHEYIPALTRYKDILSAGVLDLTNNKTQVWLHKKLKELVSYYNINGFYLDLGSAYDMPHHYNFNMNLSNPDDFKTVFTTGISEMVNVIGVSAAISRPRPPTFVSMPSLTTTWDSLKSIVPTILTYGVIGFPFVMPGAVGGDIDLDLGELIKESNSSEAIEHLPDKELYIRWMQLATFLPVIKFRHLPSKYEDGELLENLKTLIDLRKTQVLPLLKNCTEIALLHGLPIIRPLWLLDPYDPNAQVVSDEFIVGEEILVAPVLWPGTTEREIYLPSGVWKDGIDGSLRKGYRWLHAYPVPLHKIAWFHKMPDNTRF